MEASTGVCAGPHLDIACAAVVEDGWANPQSSLTSDLNAVCMQHSRCAAAQASLTGVCANATHRNRTGTMPVPTQVVRVCQMCCRCFS